MTERGVYENESAFSQLGLTPSDINQRAVIAVGYAPKELLPPYEDSSHRQRARSILTSLPSPTRSLRISGIVFFNNRYLLNLINSKKVIEVVGGRVDDCVPDATIMIMQEGRYAYVDSRHLLSSPPLNSNSVLEQTARSEIKQQYGGQHLQLRRNVTLYYDKNLVRSR